MTPTIETSLLIAGISMAGIFVFMALFYFVIVGLDKLLPFQEEKPVEQIVAVSSDDEDEYEQ
ncbi:hypothetical protein [Petrimonas sp.]|uniref:hypothetical protein n=1 Tax=Petrimonas sp. TaxID=2023866 RepID=UPI003F519008